MSLVNIALVIKFFENLLNRFFMIFVGSSDEFVIACVQKVANRADFARNLVNIFFRRNACAFCVFLNLLTVLVRSREHKNIVSLQSLKSCDCIGQNYFIAVADMRLARCVCDSRCYIKFFLICHCSPPMRLNIS